MYTFVSGVFKLRLLATKCNFNFNRLLIVLQALFIQFYQKINDSYLIGNE
jgi:hypothetical protein